MSGEWWGFVFLMLIMKVPIAYLAGVIWYACKEPEPPEPAVNLVEAPEPEPRCPWRLRRRNPARTRPPHVPTHGVRRPTRVSHAYARHE